jgi:uncharacterized protein YacL
VTAIDPPGTPKSEPKPATTTPEKATEPTWTEKVKTIGGLAAVTSGVVAVLIIAIIAIVKNTSTSATIASATAGVIATVVGAYFGMKVGTDQTKAASDGQKAEAAKAQVYAAHLPAEKAPEVLKLAEQAAKSALGK